MMKIKPSKFAIFRTLLGISFFLLVAVMPDGTSAFGQALPTAEAAPISTGFSLPTTLGSLQYAVSASQSLIWGYYGNSGAAAATNVTGDIAYLSNSQLHPFSLILSAGQSWGESGQPSYRFINLGFSQVANIGRWNFVISDNVSYLPGTPAAGLSGVAGVGDLGVNPVQVNGDTGQGVLTNFSNRVANVVAGSVSRQITGKTSVSAFGSYSITRFLDDSQTSASSSSAGLDSDSATGGAGIRHQIDARNSLGGNYSYSEFSYPANSFAIATPSFASQTASAVYSHQFTRKFTMSVAAGPQWTSINSTASSTGVSLFADVSAAYTGKSTAASAIFTRTTNAGYGSIGGALSTSVVATVSRRFEVVWNCSASSGYTKSSSLPVAGAASYSVNTYVEGVQVSRAIVRNLSGYASYTLEDQSYSAAAAIDVFSGLSQVVGFGITYAPAALHLGRQ
jgi:hypothetical protein